MRKNLEMKKNNSLKKNEKGATAIEYGLILALIALAIVGSLSGIATSVNNVLGTASTEMTIAP